MSHHTIKYDLDSPDAEAKAIDDIIDFLGQERFDTISTALEIAIKDGATVDQLRIPLSFAGVQGFPVVAWYNHLKRQLQ